MSNYQVIKFDWRELEQFGISMLTGEANGIIGMQRLLCDVTIKGKKILAEFFGICMQGMPENWNSGKREDPSIGSIMLPVSILKDLLIFCYLQKFSAVHVMKCHHGEYYIAANDVESIMEENANFKCTGIISGKNRNTHAMSGRTE